MTLHNICKSLELEPRSPLKKRLFVKIVYEETIYKDTICISEK